MAERRWALILGASSGFGEACSLELARSGWDVFGIHLDRHATLPNVQRIVGQIEASGRQAIFFNVNAADPEKRTGVVAQIEEELRRGGRTETLGVLLHSLAFGALRPLVAPDPKESITRQQMEMTLDVMAHSLIYWVQDLVTRGLLSHGSKVFAMTSSGSARFIPYYGAISAAKACLESHIRQLALELAPLGISVNGLRAGVTDTPSLRKIPGHERMMERARAHNPGGRLTTPQDVARALAVLCQPGTEWMTGNVIGVDGGEFIAG